MISVYIYSSICATRSFWKNILLFILCTVLRKSTFTMLLIGEMIIQKITYLTTKTMDRKNWSIAVH